jgi:hypothetical protein
MKQSEILSHFLSEEMITKKIKLLIPKEKEKLYNIILKNLNDFEIESCEVDANCNCSLRIYAKTKSPINTRPEPNICDTGGIQEKGIAK